MRRPQVKVIRCSRGRMLSLLKSVLKEDFVISLMDFYSILTFVVIFFCVVEGYSRRQEGTFSSIYLLTVVKCYIDLKSQNIVRRTSQLFQYCKIHFSCKTPHTLKFFIFLYTSVIKSLQQDKPVMKYINECTRYEYT